MSTQVILHRDLISREVSERLRVVAAVGIPVVANGAIHNLEDAERCLAETGAVAVMGATGLLRDPRMFSRRGLSAEKRDPFSLAREYLRFVAEYPIMGPCENTPNPHRNLIFRDVPSGCL